MDGAQAEQGDRENRCPGDKQADLAGTSSDGNIADDDDHDGDHHLYGNTGVSSRQE